MFLFYHAIIEQRRCKLEKRKSKALCCTNYYNTYITVVFHCVFRVLIAILPKDWKYVLFIFPVALAVIGLLIYVCIDRIKEIMSGEEDGLGKY